MTNIWENTKGRGCQILPLVIWARLGLLPTIIQSFLWAVKVTADIQTGPCPPFPQRYPNTQHSAIWLMVKSQKSWTQRYPALVQTTTDLGYMKNGDTDVLPRGFPSTDTVSPGCSQEEDPLPPCLPTHRPRHFCLTCWTWSYQWILGYGNTRQKELLPKKKRERDMAISLSTQLSMSHSMRPKGTWCHVSPTLHNQVF